MVPLFWETATWVMLLLLLLLAAAAAAAAAMGVGVPQEITVGIETVDDASIQECHSSLGIRCLAPCTTFGINCRSKNSSSKSLLQLVMQG